MSGGSQDPFCVCLLFFRRQFSGASLQQFGEPDDRVERRPQLMAHIGEESVFVLVRFLQIFCLFPQFTVDFLQFFRLFLELTRHSVKVELQLPHFVRRDVLEAIFQIAPAQRLGPFAHGPESFLLKSAESPVTDEDNTYRQQQPADQNQIFPDRSCFRVCFFGILPDLIGFLFDRIFQLQILFLIGCQQFQFCRWRLPGILNPFEEGRVCLKTFCVVACRAFICQCIGGPFQVAQLLIEQRKFHGSGFCKKICQCPVHIPHCRFHILILPEGFPVFSRPPVQCFIPQIREGEECGKCQQQHECG